MVPVALRSSLHPLVGQSWWADWSSLENADQSGVKLRQVKVLQDTADTVTEIFDFRKNNEKAILISGVRYVVRLLAIGSGLYDRQKFPAFEFPITWDSPEG